MYLPSTNLVIRSSLKICYDFRILCCDNEILITMTVMLEYMNSVNIGHDNNNNNNNGYF